VQDSKTASSDRLEAKRFLHMSKKKKRRERRNRRKGANEKKINREGWVQRRQKQREHLGKVFLSPAIPVFPFSFEFLFFSLQSSCELEIHATKG
jgi:hypothetical protein